MLFRLGTLQAIARGEVTLAFRRAAKAPARAGGTQRSAVGVVAFDAVDAVDDAAVGDDDARRAGFAGRAELFASLRPEGTLYRVALRHLGDDPRVALRDAVPDEEELRTLVARLGALDSRAPAPWTRATLALVAARPGAPAQTLADALGQDKPAFKRRVRALKELGLTESLEVGYRLSPRGRVLLAREGTPDGQARRSAMAPLQ